MACVSLQCKPYSKKAKLKDQGKYCDIMKSILFICAGNIFRSMSAELCLKKQLSEKHINLKVASAGLFAQKQDVQPIVKEELEKLGIDCTKHRQRKVTKKILDSSDLVVLMTKEHQRILKEEFNVDSVLFNEIAFGKKEDFLDVCDILEMNGSRKDAENYMRTAVKLIFKGTKNIAKKIETGEL